MPDDIVVLHGGSLEFTVSSDTEEEQPLVLIEFAGPTAYIGLGPEQADELAQTLREHADRIREAWYPKDVTGGPK